MKSNIHSQYIPAAAILLLIASCSGNKKKELPGVPDDVRPVAEAIVNDSPESFASVVSYPIERPYPLKNVEDSSEMVKYYSTLVDNKLKKTVEEAPDSAWQQDGWRGWTLGNEGLFFIDSGKVYEMNYISKRETQMLDSLQNEEIATLEPNMRQGWIPVTCVVDTVSGAVFRIDSQETTNPPIYRLAGYAAGTDLGGDPTLVLYGTLELEGSMANRFYHFTDDDGTTAEYSPDVCDDESSPEIYIDKKGVYKRYSAKPDYWLERVKHKDAKVKDGKGIVKPQDKHGDSPKFKPSNTKTRSNDTTANKKPMTGTQPVKDHKTLTKNTQL